MQLLYRKAGSITAMPVKEDSIQADSELFDNGCTGYRLAFTNFGIYRYIAYRSPHLGGIDIRYCCVYREALALPSIRKIRIAHLLSK